MHNDKKNKYIYLHLGIKLKNKMNEEAKTRKEMI